MGSGASDLQKVSHSTLHEELTQECVALRRAQDTLGKRNACTPKVQDRLHGLFEHMENAFRDYDELYRKRDADGQDDEELLQAIAKVNDHYCAYQISLKSGVYEVGDIVQVRDVRAGGLFVEGVVVSAADTTIEVHLDNDESDYASDSEHPADQDISEIITVDLVASSARKVKSWDTLEVGDRVRVKEGCLAFQGVVVATSDDGSEVTVSFSADDDLHGLDDDLEYESDAETEGNVYPRHMVEKIDTGRIARLRFKDTVRRVQKTLVVASAFRSTMSPRTSSPRTGEPYSSRETDAHEEVKLDADTEGNGSGSEPEVEAKGDSPEANCNTEETQ